MADVKSSNKVIDISEVVKIMRGLSITKLVNQENFLLWKEDFSTLLECLSWKYEDLKDKNLSTGCSAKIIRLTLSDDLKREFLYTDNSFDLIKDIEMKFKRTTIIDIINLKSELYTFQETDPMTMISRVKSVVMQLKQLDQIINDTEMCHIILTKLDAKYDMMKTTLTDSITLEDLVQRIKSQSDAMVTNDISETSFYVNKKFSSHNRNKNYQIKRNNVKSQLCYNCRGTGHQAKVCPSPSNYVNFSVEDDVDNIIDEDSDYGFFMGTIASMAQTMESLWIIDSGASVHITNEKSKLSNLRPLDKHIPVKTADGTILNIKECGDLYIDKILVKNVLYNENVAANLLSFVKLMEEGLLVSNGSEFKLKQKDVSIPIVSKSGVLIIDQKIRNDRVDDALMWHKRLGHANPRLIKEVTGLSMNNKCIDCASIKITRIPHKIEITANVPLERLSIDLGEPKTSETISGYRYYLAILDIFSKAIFVKPIKRKSEAIVALEKGIIFLENITGHKVRFLRSDKGTEFLNQQVSELCRRRSITQEFTESATPEANPVERYNRTLKNMTGTIIQSQRLPCKLWPEIIQSCAFLRNRLPSATTGIAPLTMLNIKFDLKRIKIIGCLTIMNQHLMNKRNLANRSEVGVLVGFGQSSLSYKVFLFSTGTVVSSCDVWFDESKDFIDSKEYYENNVLKKNKTDVYSSDDENVNDFLSKVDTKPTNIHHDTPHPRKVDIDIEKLVDEVTESLENSFNMDKTPVVKKSFNPRLPKVVNGDGVKTRNQSMTGNALKLALTLESKDNFDQSDISYENAPNEKTAFQDKNWLDAINKELSNIERMNTWSICTIPDNVKPLKTRWVFVKKPCGKYKARLVVKGFLQEDNGSFYAPTASMVSIRYLISFAAQTNSFIRLLDVTCAFLQSKLESPEYILPPTGFNCDIKGNECLQLHRALYGLRQSPKAWGETFREALLKYNFNETNFDYSVYVKFENNTFVVVLVYVDDVMIISPSDTLCIDVTNHLKNEFELKDYEFVDNNWVDFVGMELRKINNGYELCQKRKIIELINDNEKLNLTSKVTPTSNRNLDDESILLDENQKKTFLSLLGRISYIALNSRPDLSFATNRIAKYAANPKLNHLSELTRIISYLKYRPDVTLKYIKRSDDLKLECFSDASFAPSSTDLRSITGMACYLNNDLFYWSTKRQTKVARSTFIAELFALVYGTDTLMHTGKFVKLFKPESKLILYTDNLPLFISLKRDAGYSSKAKAVDIDFIYLKECLKKIEVIHVSSEEMLADSLTKPFSSERLMDVFTGRGEVLNK